MWEIKKKNSLFYRTQMAQLWDFSPELCQDRSMLENKLAEVQFKVKRDHGWKQLFVFLFFKDGASVGDEYVRLRLI